MTRRPAPVRGLRVLDLSDRIASAYCTKLLVDAGADVIKLEPPAGASLRRDGAVDTAGAPGCLFSYLCAGTRSVVAGPDDGETLAALVRWSDVVILSEGRRESESVGHDPAALAALHPGVLAVTITDFGWGGPWETRAATEFTLQAWCGATGFRGFPEGAPVSVGGRVGEYVGGVYAAVAILAAARGGWPRADAAGVRHVDLSLLECMTQSMQGYEWLHTSLMGLSGFSRSVEVPSIEPARDGWVGFSMVTGQQWRDFATMVAQPALVDDPELCLQLGRWPRRAEIYALVHPWLATRTVDEVVQQASLFRVPAASIGTGATIVDMDHFVARHVFAANPAGFRQPRPPWQMSHCAPARLRRAPALGEHQDAVRGLRKRRAVDADEAATQRLVTDREEEALPLSGVRIIDLTAFWAGPSSTFILAALGADVVKIESVQRPDGMRFAGGTLAGAEKWWEHSWIFHGVNAGKRSVTLDLGHPDGQRIVRTLIAGADVVVENFSPRVIEQFDLGWDVLCRLNPRLVMVRMPAFGLDGPWRDRVGFAPTMEQLSGMAWRTGLPDGPPISPRGACDPIAGAHAAFALLAALAHRERTGEGQLVEVPMVEVALNLTAEQVMVFEQRGELLARQGNRGVGAPQNVYRCAGDDAWVALAVESDAQWGGLVRALGAPPWAEDPALATAPGRRGAADALDAQLAEWFSAREVGEAVEVLAHAGVPVAEVVPSPLVLSNPQLEARGFFERLEHPEAGSQDYAGLPFRPAPAAGWCRRPPPTLGEHNDEVLGDEAGLSASERTALRRSQVIGDRPRGL